LSVAVAAPSAEGHAGLIAADPGIEATLGASPTEVRLSFSEQPEVSLSEISVLGPGGAAEQRSAPEPVDGDPLSLSVPIGPLPRGVYTVDWKVVSAVDGHATDGAYAFGVRQAPKGAVATSTDTTSPSPWLELIARWLYIGGIVALLGAATAAVARFGGSSDSDLRLATGGLAVSGLGLLLLADAQRRSAGSSLGVLLETPIGTALLWRALAFAAATAVIVVAWRATRWRRLALGLSGAAALAAIVAHVAAGHAAAGGWPAGISVAAQATHFVAAGVWLGGLVALLLGVRGEPSEAKAAAVRRFSAVALVALVLVAATGTLRAFDELPSWGQLFTNGYGRAIVAKVALIALIAVVAARNRSRSVPTASADLAPLRRRSRVEIAVAIAALGVAALLGTLAPPISAAPTAPTGLSTSGSDFGTTTRVELTTTSPEPGPNRFHVVVEDYDSGEPLRAGAVTLGFTPLDDPGVGSSSLKLRRTPDGSFVGSGANLAFDGRWEVDVLVERGDASVEVPLDLNLPGPRQFVSELRVPGRPPQYTMLVGTGGNLRIEPVPERPGASRIIATCFTIFGSECRVETLVLTASPEGGATRQQRVRRVGVGRFVARVELEPGPFRIGVVVHTRYGERLRGVFRLEIPSD
jgi:copper transport protein